MNKNNSLNIYFVSLDDFENAGTKALDSGKPLVQKENEIYFSSVKEFEKFFSMQKFHILNYIKLKKPESIYSLAKMVHRDFANVSKDCASLYELGFIILRDSDHPRGNKRPELSFDYDAITVHLPEPKITYQHILAA